MQYLKQTVTGMWSFIISTRSGMQSWIRIFLPDDMLDATIRELSKCIMVDSKLAITLDYKED